MSPPLPVALGLGANLGDPEATLRDAAQSLGRALAPSLGAARVASLYRSAPLSPIEQPDFWNTVVVWAAPALDAPALRDLAVRLLARGRELERRAGRVPGPRWGPRPLDVDVLLVGGLVHREEALEVPHPELRRRAFVLAPLAELEPALCLPGDGAAVAHLLAAVADQPLERRPWRAGRPAGDV